MNAIQATARRAGLLYVLFSMLAVVGYMYIPATMVVPGDATATARRITDGALMYRAGVLAALVGQILFIVLVLTLYQLFKDVDRKQARLMVVLVCVGATAEIVNLSNRMAPLMLLSGAGFLSAFTKPQLDALSLGFIRLGSSVGQLLTAFWGLWLFPFGILTIRSGFFPKILGVLLFASGFAYTATCVASLVVPAQRQLVSQVMTPLYLGELGMVIWLAVVGARVPRVEGQEPVS